MKKFMGITLIVAIVAMIGSIISFFVFDFGDFIDAQTRWNKRLGHRLVMESGEWISDIILNTVVDGIGESIERAVEKKSNYIASRWESKIDQFATDIEKTIDDAVEFDYNFQRIMDTIYPNILKKIGMKDGYITKQNIIDGQDLVIEEWTQSIEQIKNIKLNAENLNLIVGATKGNDFEFYITRHLRSADYAIKLDKETKEESYYITIHESKKENTEGYYRICNLYILIPEQYQGNVNVDMENGNVILSRQRNDIDITLENGNIIAHQVQNHDFRASIINGNIITDLVTDLDAKLELKITNGKAIGFGKKAIFSNLNGIDYKKTFVNGKYEVNLKIENGNIIGY